MRFQYCRLLLSILLIGDDTCTTIVESLSTTQLQPAPSKTTTTTSKEIKTRSSSLPSPNQRDDPTPTLRHPTTTTTPHHHQSLSSYHSLPYHSALATLRTYHSHHGNLAIPRRFLTPSSPHYPPEWHHAPLSSIIYTMKWWQRHISPHPHRVAELNELGFLWDRLQPEWNLVLEALVVYRDVNGDLLVPTSFVVPLESETYPPATWGIKLGCCVRRIRSRQDFTRGRPNRVRQLNGLGFVWDGDEYRFQMFVSALRRYAALEGLDNGVGGGTTSFSFSTATKKVLRIPTDFVIPCDDSRWPCELWNYPLGVKCLAVRQKGVYVKNHPERVWMLKDVGFWFGGNAALGWLEVVHAAAIYSRMHGRRLEVPTSFVVPEPPCCVEEGMRCSSGDWGEWPWPEQLWGLPLGQRLRDVRLKGRYLTGDSAASRRAQLNNLGFVWHPKRGRRKRHLGGGQDDDDKEEKVVVFNCQSTIDDDENI